MAYWRIVWGQRTLILIVMLAAAVISAGVSLLMPNIYRAQVMMAPVSHVNGASDSGSLASALGSMGVPSLAGIAPDISDTTGQNLAVLRSRSFLWSFIKDDKLLPILLKHVHGNGNQNDYWHAYRALSGLMSVHRNRFTGLVTVSVDRKNAKQAAEWANALVSRLNAYLRQQAIASSAENLHYLHQALDKATVAGVRQVLFQLILQEQKKAMLANVQKQFAFRIIDPAVAPDIKVKPRRSSIVITATFIAGLLAIVFVIARERLSVQSKP